MPVGPYGALLDAVRGVRWPARRAVPGGAPGAHVARTRGVAPEFAEYRPYRQGDDPRRLDWKLLARSDRAFIRLAPDQAILATTLLVDASASMDFAGKWLFARRLTMGLAAVAHASADPVGLTVVAGDGTRRLQPRARRGVLADVARTLDAVTPNGSAALAPEVARAAARVVVLTDCLGDFDALRAALAQHVARGSEAHVVYVVSADELRPPANAMLAVDPEDKDIRRPLVASTRTAYEEGFDAFRQSVLRRLRADGVVVHGVVDDTPPEMAVRRITRGGVVEVAR